MKRKLWKQTGFGAILGLALWVAFTVLAAWLRGQWSFPAVSGHLVLLYGSELGAVTAQCTGAVLCGILWCNASLIFRETDWNLLKQTAVHILVCMIPALAVVWAMGFMPSSLDGLMQYLRLFGVIYGVNWLVSYLKLREGVKQINARLDALAGKQNQTETEIFAKEEMAMTNQRKWYRHPAVAVLMLVICACVPLTGWAAGNSGFFRDIMRGSAVVGTKYEQATDEIEVSAAVQGGTLVVQVIFEAPEAFPYREQDTLALGNYRILDQSGAAVQTVGECEAASVENGGAVIAVPVNGLKSGAYILQIHSFVGEKKADQPLEISGRWECPFTME